MRRQRGSVCGYSEGCRLGQVAGAARRESLAGLQAREPGRILVLLRLKEAAREPGCDECEEANDEAWEDAPAEGSRGERYGSLLDSAAAPSLRMGVGKPALPRVHKCAGCVLPGSVRRVCIGENSESLV